MPAKQYGQRGIIQVVEDGGLRSQLVFPSILPPFGLLVHIGIPPNVFGTFLQLAKEITNLSFAPMGFQIVDDHIQTLYGFPCPLDPSEPFFVPVAHFIMGYDPASVFISNGTAQRLVELICRMSGPSVLQQLLERLNEVRVFHIPKLGHDPVYVCLNVH